VLVARHCAKPPLRCLQAEQRGDGQIRENKTVIYENYSRWDTI